jgi:hypothetical protein
LEDTAPLLNVLTALTGAPFMFVTVLGSVGGIVTLSDMQKPPVTSRFRTATCAALDNRGAQR